MALTSTLTATPTGGEVRCRPCPTCYVCGALGKVLYSAMRDRLFDVPGEWSVMKCPCLDCGSLWLDPMPIDDDLIKLYETYFTHDAVAPSARPRSARSRLFAFVHPIFQAHIAFPLCAIGRTNGGRLLDIGCGKGELLELAQRLGWQATGVDFDPEAVSNSRSRGLEVRLGGIEVQHFPPGAFDLIVLSHVIEHLADPVSALRECRRVLASGGSVLLATPNAQCWGHSVFGPNWLGLDVPRHLHVFTPNGIKSVAALAGFTRASISTIPRFAQYYFSQGARLNRDSRFSSNSYAFSLGQWLPPRAAVLFESMFTRLRPMAGEEIIMRAQA